MFDLLDEAITPDTEALDSAVLTTMRNKKGTRTKKNPRGTPPPNSTGPGKRQPRIPRRGGR